MNSPKTKISILNRILNLTGSQWRSARTGVICEKRGVRDTNRAAAFCRLKVLN